MRADLAADPRYQLYLEASQSYAEAVSQSIELTGKGEHGEFKDAANYARILGVRLSMVRSTLHDDGSRL
jgi:hypothetical protein